MKKLLFVIMMLTSCTVWGSEMLLKCKDVQFFKTVEHNSAIEVSGLAMHSSLAVNDIETVKSGDSITIIVHLVPARKGLRGEFSYKLDLPETINSVSFGTADCVIWKRGIGPIMTAPLKPTAR